MANRDFYPPKGYYDAGVVPLMFKVSIGAAGAVSSFSGKGVASIVKTAATTGRYTVTLSDRFFGTTVLHSSIGFTGTTTAAAGGAVAGYLRNDLTGTATKTVQVQLYGAANADADAETGTSFTCCLFLKDSTV